MYTLSAYPFRFLNDSPERLDFHIKSDDYLSFVATKLGFIEEALRNCTSGLSDQERTVANELRHDLRYVQAHYKITPRSGSEMQTMRPSGDLLSK
jgi:hypothetical protein